MITFKPQKGFQEKFLSSPADIVIGGGKAGLGKTYALLLEPCRHIRKSYFKGHFFRRTTPQIRNSGGLWDSSVELYRALGGGSRETSLQWIFANNVRISMGHLETVNDIYSHDGAQYTYIAFDQLEHFTKKQFFYMLSRNRDAQSGVQPYIRCTANPVPSTDKAGGWLRDLIDWFIGKDGYPIKEREGVIRYFTQEGENGDVQWVYKDWKSAEGLPPTSFTFIGGTSIQEDNPILATKNPKYLSDLNSLDRISRLRLKSGNWNAKEEDGMFESSWFKIKDHVPDLKEKLRVIRYWDRASTPKEESSNPDWTVGAKCTLINNELWVLDIKRFRGTPAENERQIKLTAEHDGKLIQIGFEEEGGSAGKDVAFYYQTNVLKGFHVTPDRPTGSKIERARPWCAWAEQGHVYLLRGSWNAEFQEEASSFPNYKKDQVDAVSGAFKLLTHKFEVTGGRLPI